MCVSRSVSRSHRRHQVEAVDVQSFSAGIDGSGSMLTCSWTYPSTTERGRVHLFSAVLGAKGFFQSHHDDDDGFF